MKSLVLLIPIAVFTLAAIFGGWITFIAALIGAALALFFFITERRYDLIVPVLGLAMNLIAISANHWTMPVLNPPDSALDASHSIMTQDTKAKAFCDVIPLGGYAFISLGDIFIIGFWPLTIGAIYGYNKYKLRKGIANETSNCG